MGNDYALRQQNLMTQLMLQQEQTVIQMIQEEALEVNQIINQMGDTLLHYAAYKSMKKLINYLLEHQADPYIQNYRHLTSIDVSMPEIREWIIRKRMVLSNGKSMPNRNLYEQAKQMKSIREQENDGSENIFDKKKMQK